jgi:hypothetical protein
VQTIEQSTEPGPATAKIGAFLWKIPLNFPANGNSGAGDRFESDCVRHQHAVPEHPQFPHACLVLMALLRRVETWHLKLGLLPHRRH